MFALQHTGAGLTAILSSTAPVWALLFAAVFLRERPGIVQLVGTSICLGGGFVVVGLGQASPADSPCPARAVGIRHSQRTAPRAGQRPRGTVASPRPGHVRLVTCHLYVLASTRLGVLTVLASRSRT